jgi:glycosyltransferase involved in cell wall biosynthesis
MPHQPLVSIVTPSFNQVEYLEAAIQSVLTQDYPNIEYIVIDGASTDGSAAIIERYASQLAYSVSEPDHGQADAINKGLTRIKGEFVAWLNSDDFYLPGAVSSAVAAFVRNPDAGLAYADVQAVNAAGQPLNRIRYQPYMLADLLALRIIGQPAVFIRRAALEKAGFLDEDYQYLLDHHLWVRIARDWPLSYSPEVWAAARYHPAAKNIAKAAGFGLEGYRILEWAAQDPQLHAVIDAHPRRMWGGAHRLHARYLLDGGQYWASLRAYGKALVHDPVYALEHWHRMLFALALGLVSFMLPIKKDS